MHDATIPPAPSSPAQPANPTTAAWIRTGGWDRALMVLWLAVLTLSLAVIVKAAPESYRQAADLTDPTISDPEAMRAGLREVGVSPRTLANFSIVITVLSTSLQIAIAALLLRSRTPIAAIIAVGLVAMTAAQYPPAIPDLFPSQPVWIFLARVVTLIGMSFFFTLPFIFPSGRFVPKWTVVSVAVAVVGVGQFAFFPDLDTGVGAVGLILNAASTLFVLGAAVAAQVYRYRRVSTELERQQTKWVIFGLAIAGSGFVIGDTAVRAIGDGTGGILALLVFVFVMPILMAALPVTLAIALLRHRLFDIDLIINRTLVYLLLTGMVVGAYALVVVGVGRLIDARNNLVLSLVATGIVAVGFQPLRLRVQRGVNRLLYGDRDDPYGVLSRLGQRLEGTIAPDEILPAIVRTLTEALRLPYAAISLHDGPDLVLATAAGVPAAGVVRLPLVYQSEPVGELVVAPRSPGESFGPADRRLLADLARQAGIAAHAVRLTVDLQRARERLVTAREEERRRLRRDLHDGLGSQLSALAIQAASLRGQIARDPVAATATAAELRAELKASVGEIRRLVHGLRPPSLDELGLTGALRERARRFDGAGDGLPEGAALRVTFAAPDDLPTLPAAIEVATYRILEEAITNVVRHAAARTCSVQFWLEANTVCLEIADDGSGIAVDAATGIGLGSMRERAAELGGTCTIAPRPGGGTLVVARLPRSL